MHSARNYWNSTPWLTAASKPHWRHTAISILRISTHLLSSTHSELHKKLRVWLKTLILKRSSRIVYNNKEVIKNLLFHMLCWIYWRACQLRVEFFNWTTAAPEVGTNRQSAWKCHDPSSSHTSARLCCCSAEDKAYSSLRADLCHHPCHGEQGHSWPL